MAPPRDQHTDHSWRGRDGSSEVFSPCLFVHGSRFRSEFHARLPTKLVPLFQAAKCWPDLPSVGRTWPPLHSLGVIFVLGALARLLGFRAPPDSTAPSPQHRRRGLFGRARPNLRRCWPLVARLVQARSRCHGLAVGSRDAASEWGVGGLRGRAGESQGAAQPSSPYIIRGYF